MPPHPPLLSCWLFLSLLLAQQEGALGQVGFNWGLVSSQPVPPSIVVKMLRANKISHVKLFNSDPQVLGALAGSGIEVTVGVPNEFLQPFSSSPSLVDEWVRSNISRFIKDQPAVNIKYIAVGNEPFLTAYQGQFQNYTYVALNNVYQSLVNVGLGNQVKVTVPFNADVLMNTLPSKGQFRPDIKEAMRQILTLLSQINAPFIVNIYPFIDLVQSSEFPEDYAFFDGTTHPLIDGGATYTNALDASFDMAVAAVSSLGFASMQVVVGEIGWPTDGAVHANISNAQKFNQGLVKHIMSKQGTPLRPGTTMQVYLFGLFDENQKSVLPGNFERHWGVFTFDGQGKYPLDLTGQGLNTLLVNAENVPYLPARWCVANPSSTTANLLANAAFACASADCTVLAEGASCSKLGAPANVSYAFNSYYQLNNQNASSCHFNGLGVITFVDPSVGDCRFLVGVSSSRGTIPHRFLILFLVLFLFVVSTAF